MLRSEIVLTIPGTPAPKGSLKCVGGRGRHQLVEDNPETSVWRSRVASLVLRSVREGKIPTAVRGQALGAEIATTVERPRSHMGTGRNSGRVKPSAPIHPTTRSSYDVDKLLRLILDALQDVDVLDDDAQIVEATTRKSYPDGPLPDALPWPGVRIRLYPIGE